MNFMFFGLPFRKNISFYNIFSANCTFPLEFRFCFCLLIILLFQGCEKNPVTPPDNANQIQIGNLSASQSDLIINNTESVTFRFQLDIGINYSESEIQLSKVDASGNSAEQIGLLKDDGDTVSGDELKGDGIFTAVIPINEPNPSEINYAAIAPLIYQGNSVVGKSNLLSVNFYNSISDTTILKVKNTLNTAGDYFLKELNGNINNYFPAIRQTVAFLKTQSGVANATGGVNSSDIEIVFNNGLTGGITVPVQEANGSTTCGGLPLPDDSLKNERSVPEMEIESHSKIESNFTNEMSNSDNSDNIGYSNDIAANRKVFVYNPFDEAFDFNPCNVFEKNLTQFSCEYFVFKKYKNRNANISILSEMEKYGVVVLFTHGSMDGKGFLTGEVVEDKTSNYTQALLQSEDINHEKYINIVHNIVIKNTGSFVRKKTVFGVRYNYIRDKINILENSLIFAFFCNSAKDINLQNAFISRPNKSAKTYYGNTLETSDEFMEEMAGKLSINLRNGFNTGMAYDSIKPDKHDQIQRHDNAKGSFNDFLIKGSREMKFPLDMSNGNFETGNLNYWSDDGFSGAAHSMGSIIFPPPVGIGINNYMAYISTRKNLFVGDGSISHCVTQIRNPTTLTFEWNFVSQEFLKYVNSEYQDNFQILLVKSDNNVIPIFKRAIDDIHRDLALYQLTSLNAYMTGWKDTTLNIPSIPVGDTFTLKFLVENVGDNRRQTVALIDNIKIE